MSHCPGAVSMLRSYKQEALKHQWSFWVSEWCSVKGQKEHVLLGFFQWKEIFAVTEKKERVQYSISDLWQLGFTKVKMSEMPLLSASSLLVWSQPGEQLPPIWWFVSNQTECEQVVSVQAFTWRLLRPSLPASAENIGKQCLCNL